MTEPKPSCNSCKWAEGWNDKADCFICGNPQIKGTLAAIVLTQRNGEDCIRYERAEATDDL